MGGYCTSKEEQSPAETTGDTPIRICCPCSSSGRPPVEIAACLSTSKEQLVDFKFNCFRYEKAEMCHLYVQMLSHLDVPRIHAISNDKIGQYARAVAGTYHENAYHNFHHAFSTCQFLFGMMSRFANDIVCFYLSERDILAMFMAALVHDAEHPGNNNAFEVATKSELALRYNDTSVLEQHSVAMGFEIMRSNKDADLFGSFKAEDRGELRDIFTSSIIKTDMALHFAMVDRMKEIAASGEKEPFSRESLDKRRELTGIIIHSCDISNPLLPDFTMARAWSERINTEFWNQYQAELELCLPPTKMWEKINTPLGFYSSQVGFIGFIVVPLWEKVMDIFPKFDENTNLWTGLANNKETWSRLVKEAKEAKESEGS